jgi:hypothetical protein
MKASADEIVSLNEAILTLDPEGLRPVELEPRLELAVGAVQPCCLCNAFSCNVFAGCQPEGAGALISDGIA